jgi:hypothetical protein
MGTGRQPAPTRSLLEVPPTPLPAAAPAATSGASPARVGGAATEPDPPAAHEQPAADVRSCAPRPAFRSVRDVGCASCPPSDVYLGLDDRAKVAALTSGADLRSLAPATLASWRPSSCSVRPAGRGRGPAWRSASPAGPIRSKSPGRRPRLLRPADPIAGGPEGCRRRMVVSAAAALTSSVRVITGLPLCRPAFPQVDPNRQGRR